MTAERQKKRDLSGDTAVFEDAGRAKESRQPLEAWEGKEMDSPWKPPEGTEPYIFFFFLTHFRFLSSHTVK